jgi:hypothetical protein
MILTIWIVFSSVLRHTNLLAAIGRYLIGGVFRSTLKDAAEFERRKLNAYKGPGPLC